MESSCDCKYNRKHILKTKPPLLLVVITLPSLLLPLLPCRHSYPFSLFSFHTLPSLPLPLPSLSPPPPPFPLSPSPSLPSLPLPLPSFSPPPPPFLLSPSPHRRLLQVGVYNAELFTNLGLCCFYSQQYDMAISCLQRALHLSPNDETTADVWYNIGHVALVHLNVYTMYYV